MQIRVSCFAGCVTASALYKFTNTNIFPYSYPFMIVHIQFENVQKISVSWICKVGVDSVLVNSSQIDERQVLLPCALVIKATVQIYILSWNLFVQVNNLQQSQQMLCYNYTCL